MALFAVRFSDTEQDITGLWVAPVESVRHVKHRIQKLRPTLAHRRLRLIYSGRVLTDGIYLAPWIQSLLEKKGQQNYEQASSSTSSTSKSSSSINGKGKNSSAQMQTVWLQCVVGNHLSEEEENAPTPKENTTTSTTRTRTEQPSLDNNSQDELETATEQEQENESHLQGALGFDRLREAGFSDSDIASMRQQFHHSRQFDGLGNDEIAPGDDDEHSRALEDQWIEGIATQNDPIESSSTNYTILLQGLLMGFCVPIIPFFFFRSHIFSRRMQMAIVAGALINILAGLARRLL